MNQALRAEDFASDAPYFTSRHKAQDRKTDQLCAQIQRSLSFLLETECADDRLAGLYVESVRPHPNAACLLVVLQQWDRQRRCDLASVLHRLAEVKGYWRTEIGNAIRRKKTPDLVFQVLLEGGVR
jgi:Ribosome-binding factor A